MTKVGIRRENKEFELRTPIIPTHVKQLSKKYGFNFTVEPSDQRTFPEEIYQQQGASIGELRGTPIPIIFGIKEIPIQEFEANKVYLFFAHVIKGQPQNMPMLRQILDVGATLIDYERIVNIETGARLVFFGNWAGYVGMAETLLGFGQRLKMLGIKSNPFEGLRPTYEYQGLQDLEAAIQDCGQRIRKEGFSSELAPLAVGFIGYGNVSRGAQAIFDILPHKEVTPADLAELQPDSHLLYKVVFREEDTVCPSDPSAEFELQHYYHHGNAKYRSKFTDYLPYLTMIINGIFWSEKYPKMITKSDLQKFWKQTQGKPRLKIVGDISCDIEGAIEFTVKCTKPNHPTFVYDPETGKISSGVEGKGIVVMAIDNLPAELPREASTSFSESLLPFIPPIVEADYTVPFDQLDLPPEVKKAVIVYQGKLTPDYEYLEKYL